MFRRRYQKAIALGLMALLVALVAHGVGHAFHTDAASASPNLVQNTPSESSECPACSFVRRLKNDDGWFQTFIHLTLIPQGKIFPLQQLLQFFVFALVLFSRAPPF